jgi:transcriptional regulator EpsA
MNAPDGEFALDLYSAVHSEALVRVIDTAMQVRRRHQFFRWSQSALQSFLPHQVSVCGAYQRQLKALAFDCFYSVPLPAALLASFSNGQSLLLQRVVAEWIARGGRCAVLDAQALASRVGGELAAALGEAGLGDLLVHAVARPQRTQELESIFILSAPASQRWGEPHRQIFELLLPHIHATYLRVQLTERELGRAAPAPKSAAAVESRSPITVREREVLLWVRDGMSNPEIGAQLEISALTVKNHVQKILRKLGAANRTEAVARAISESLIPSNRSDQRS